MNEQIKQDIDLIEILFYLKKKIRVILFIIAICMVMVLLFLYINKDNIKVTYSLKINQTTPGILVSCDSNMNRPGFPGECFICELRLPDHRFRWKHNKLFLLLPEEYGPAFPAIVDCYTSPPT
ncbi:putative inner membrane protein [Escherichia coli]|nr:putative inner membrane protein [Escherichia coli]ETY51628.1 hypothetical protein P811_03736 [Escherichia coli BIDMC 49b]ETY53437.1 hypothetical protein P810_03769 [Escherichia coli BIDMC 49a]